VCVCVCVCVCVTVARNVDCELRVVPRDQCLVNALAVRAELRQSAAGECALVAGSAVLTTRCHGMGGKLPCNIGVLGVSRLVKNMSRATSTAWVLVLERTKESTRTPERN
jgi:hypothetical protein